MIERGGEIIRADAWTGFGCGLDEGVGRFALGAKRDDRVAQFLNRRHTHLRRTDAGDEADDAFVVAGAFEGLDDVEHARLPAAAEEFCGGIVGHVFDEALLEINFEDGRAGDTTFPRGAHDAADDRHENDDRANGGENPSQKFFHRRLLL